MDLKQVFADRRPTPDAIQQLILGDEFAPRLAQNLENFKSAPAQRRGCSAHSEFAPTKVDLTLA
jgi:hypothetical protein